MNNNKYLRQICISSVMGAVGFILMLLEFPLPFIVPEILKFDFSEYPALITSFAYGPFWGVIVCLLKNLLHLPITKTAGIGELSNFLLGSVFVAVCGFIYKYKKTRKFALISSIIGAASMALICFPLNYFIIYPAYSKILKFPVNDIVNWYTVLIPYIDSLTKALLIVNVPFTLFKGIIDVVICLFTYKKLSPILKKQ